MFTHAHPIAFTFVVSLHGIFDFSLAIIIIVINIIIIINLIYLILVYFPTFFLNVTLLGASSFTPCVFGGIHISNLYIINLICILNKYCIIWYCKCDAVQCDEMKTNKLNWIELNKKNIEPSNFRFFLCVSALYEAACSGISGFAGSH